MDGRFVVKLPVYHFSQNVAFKFELCCLQMEPQMEMLNGRSPPRLGWTRTWLRIGTMVWSTWRFFFVYDWSFFPLFLSFILEQVCLSIKITASVFCRGWWLRISICVGSKHQSDSRVSACNTFLILYTGLLFFDHHWLFSLQTGQEARQRSWCQST